MKQAKVLSEKEFKQLMSVVAASTHGQRNRMALMLSHYAGHQCCFKQHCVVRAGKTSRLQSELQFVDLCKQIKETSGVFICC